MTQDTRKTRMMGKSELAQLYFPNSTPRSARNAFLRYINRNRDLKALLSSPDRAKAHYYTPKEVEAIIDYLGEP